jgi:hypothetical protein
MADGRRPGYINRIAEIRRPKRALSRQCFPMFCSIVCLFASPNSFSSLLSSSFFFFFGLLLSSSSFFFSFVLRLVLFFFPLLLIQSKRSLLMIHGVSLKKRISLR